MEKTSERGLMYIAGKPKKKIFNLRGFNCVMFLRIERKILTSTDRQNIREKYDNIGIMCSGKVVSYIIKIIKKTFFDIFLL